MKNQSTEKKYGAIDIGSNAIRCLIKSVSLDIEGKQVSKKISMIRVPIRLGKDVFNNKSISSSKKERLINALKGFWFLLQAHEIDKFRTCATSAFREAENAKAVVREIKKQTGIIVDVISGTDEARIIFDAGISELLDEDKSYLYVDVGGGSTELTLFSNHEIVAAQSFKVGTVRILERQTTSKEWEDMRLWVDQNVVKKGIKPDCIIGSGGNINRLVKLVPGSGVDSKIIKKAELKTLFADLSELTYEERIRQYQLSDDRADVIVPAAKIFLSLLRWSNTQTIFAPKFGLTDGIIHEIGKVYLEKATT